MDTATTMSTPAAEWAKVEIMGHRTRCGLCQEIERFGTKLIRIDVYRPGEESPCLSEYYAGSALFSYSPCTEELARTWASRSYNLPPEARLALPAPEEPPRDAAFEEVEPVEEPCSECGEPTANPPKDPGAAILCDLCEH